VTSAVEAATRALALEAHEGVQYPAARVLIAAREGKRAEPIAAAMEKAPQRPTRSYGRLLGAALLLDRGEPQKAIDAIQEALKLHDSWAGHALLAEANMAAGKHVQAADQWELCLARRGEATDAFFADTSTLRYLAPVHYWLARAHEANGSAGSARASYETFAALRGQADPGDRLALDARQRLLALPR
jgi:hypothetical protein